MRCLALAALLPSVALAQSPIAPASIVTGQKHVGALLVQIVAARPRVWADVTVDGPGECYFGPAGVTTATGYPLRSGRTKMIPTSAAVYAVCASDTTVGFDEFPVTGD